MNGPREGETALAMKIWISRSILHPPEFSMKRKLFLSWGTHSYGILTFMTFLIWDDEPSLQKWFKLPFLWCACPYKLLCQLRRRKMLPKVEIFFFSAEKSFFPHLWMVVADRDIYQGNKLHLITNHLNIS